MSTHGTTNSRINQARLAYNDLRKVADELRLLDNLILSLEIEDDQILATGVPNLSSVDIYLLHNLKARSGT